MSSSSNLTLRPVTPNDFSQIASILNYYILHSIATFRTIAVDDTAISATYEEAKTQELPFLVVVGGDRVLGYIYALGFRAARPGYRHTVEISVYVHPDCRGKGIGNKLMNGLFDGLKARGQGDNNTAISELPEKKITEVIAVMAFDAHGSTLEESKKLRGWYTRWGFEQVGQMKRIGWKFGRWLDDVIMQTSLE